jgi:MFS family permease
MLRHRSSFKKFWTACLGNLFEHYDTALFGFLSPFLAPLIFPKHDPLTALILTYAITPLGMIARPLGALFFGYIGDRHGRTHALFFTLGGMAFVSGCIAFTPTYAQVGLLAPLLFFLGRSLQNFLAAGETMGGAIFLLEHSSEKKHDLLSSLYATSSISGHLLASFGVFFLSQQNFIDPGWRLLYVVGCITALFGCMLRYSLPSPAYEIKAQNSFPLKQTIWKHRKPLFFVIVSSGFIWATYSIALILMNGFIPLVSSVTKVEIMKVNSYLLILDACMIPVFGWIASRMGREKLMLATSWGVIVFAIPLFLSLDNASFLHMIGIRTIFVILGVAFTAPFHAWVQQLFPADCRYALISLGYAIGSQLLGSPTAAVALWCFQKTGMISSVAWYWMALALATILSITATTRSPYVKVSS